MELSFHRRTAVSPACKAAHRRPSSYSVACAEQSNAHVQRKAVRTKPKQSSVENQNNHAVCSVSYSCKAQASKPSRRFPGSPYRCYRPRAKPFAPPHTCIQSNTSRIALRHSELKHRAIKKGRPSRPLQHFHCPKNLSESLSRPTCRIKPDHVLNRVIARRASAEPCGGVQRAPRQRRAIVRS